MYVKVHESETRIVVAICDENLIGKKFSDGELQLKITERFYKGEKKSDKEVAEIMKQADNLNLVGEKTINLALKNRVISKSSIIKIKKIPHAHVFGL